MKLITLSYLDMRYQVNILFILSKIMKIYMCVPASEVSIFRKFMLLIVFLLYN